jgi:hypothetical protein
MFFIRDCNDVIVGNPKGYATMRGAQAQQSRPTAPAHQAIWAAYYKREKAYDAAGVPKHERKRGICSIRLNEEA